MFISLGRKRVFPMWSATAYFKPQERLCGGYKCKSARRISLVRFGSLSFRMARDSGGVANLFVAIEQNDHDRVKHLMEAYHISPNANRTKIVSQKETQTYTPLYLAASLDRSRICDFLLSQGADPYGKMVYGMYPIHVACDRVFVAVLEVFLQHSCDLNRKDDNGDTPLHLAALRGSVECVHLLTVAGADLDARNKAGKTPFEEAMQHQRWDVVRYLRDHYVSKQKFPGVQGSRVNTQDDSGEELQCLMLFII